MLIFKKFWLLALVLIITPSIAFAADLQTNEKGQITVGTTGQQRNVYVGATDVQVEGNTLGDVTAASRTVDVSGTIEQNLNVATQTLSITGAINNSVRALAQYITVDGKIGGDFFAAAQSVNINSGASVTNDVAIAAADIKIDGNVDGKLYAAANYITINGPINGNVTLRSQNITIGDKAVISGKLTYYSPAEASISSQAKIAGGTEFKKVETKHNYSGILTLAVLMGLLESLLVVLILIYGLPKLSESVMGYARSSALLSLAYGAAFIVLMPIVCIVLLISVIGVKLAFLIGLLMMLLIALSVTFTPVLLGMLISKLIDKNKKDKIDWVDATVGVLVASILMIIPVIGALVLFILFLITLGALVRYLFTDAYAFFGRKPKV